MWSRSHRPAWNPQPLAFYLALRAGFCTEPNVVEFLLRTNQIICCACFVQLFFPPYLTCGLGDSSGCARTDQGRTVLFPRFEEQRRTIQKTLWDRQGLEHEFNRGREFFFKERHQLCGCIIGRKAIAQQKRNVLCQRVLKERGNRLTPPGLPEGPV